MFDKALVIKAYRIEKQNVANQNLPVETEIVYLENTKRRIVDLPYYRDFRIQSGMQVNEKAQKLMYLQPNDSWLPQNTIVIWEFRGKRFSGKVKFTKAKGAINLGYDKEVYIQSDNE